MYCCFCHCTHKSRDTDSLPAVRSFQGCSFGCFISAFALNDACICRLCIQMAAAQRSSRGLFCLVSNSALRPWLKSQESREKYYVFTLH